MKRKALANFTNRAVLLPLGLLACSGVVSASDIDVEGSVNWNNNTTGSLTITLGSTTSTVRAGEPALTVNEVIDNSASGVDPILPAGLSDVPEIGDFSSYAWCIDPLQSAASNVTYTWDLVALEDAPYPGPAMMDNADDMRLLFGNVYSSVLGGTAPITGLSYNATDLFNAFQLAIWEISKETSDTYSLSGIDGGVFQATAPTAAIDLAEGWLTELNALNDADDTTVSAFTMPAANNLFALESSSKQDYIVAIDIPGGGTTPVPLPAAVWLFGSALLGMVGVGYRRRKES